MNKKIIATNPVAKRNYTITDTIEAGIVLSGTEIKSIINGKVNLKDSYAGIRNGEVFIYSMHISPYEQGYTLVPMNLYFSGHFIKLELGIGKGKKLYDKREDIAKKDAELRIKKQSARY